LDMRRDEIPGALVLRLFLAPDNLGLRKAVEFQCQHILREGIELFEAQDLNAALVARFARVHQVEIDFSAAQYDALYLLVVDEFHRGRAGHDFGLIAQHAMERRTGAEIDEERGAALMAQKRLWRHQDERLAERAMHLAAQDMEIVRRRRAIGDLHSV